MSRTSNALRLSSRWPTELGPTRAVTGNGWSRTKARAISSNEAPFSVLSSSARRRRSRLSSEK